MTAVLDSYNRTSSSSLGVADIGGTYVAEAGTWGTNGTQAYLVTGIASNWTSAVIDTGEADVTVETTVGTMSSDGFAGLRIRSSGATAGITVLATRMWNTAFAATPIGPVFSQTFVSGDGMRVVTSGTTITVYRQAGATGAWTQVATTTTSTYLTNTKHGLGAWGVTAQMARWNSLDINGYPAYIPDVKVEIAFNSGYTSNVISRVWTDVSPYVELAAGISISYGRADEFGQADPNKLALTLDNSDGRFTAGKTGGAYYPNVKIGRPIRVTSTLNGVGYVRFLGYVDEWPTAWNGGTSYATAQITAQSRMARLGFGSELRSTITEEYLSPDGSHPLAYWPLNEAQGATSAADLMGGPSLTNAGWGVLAEFGKGMGLPGDPEATGAFFIETGSQRLQTTLTTPLSTAYPNVVSVEGFITAQDVTSIILDNDGSGNSPYLYLYSADDVCACSYFDGTNSLGVAVAFDSSEPHHLAGQIELDAVGVGTVTLWVDGVVAATDTLAGMVAATLKYAYIGNYNAGVPEAQTIAHIAINADMTAGRIAARANAGITGFAGESAGVRIGRYAGYGGIDDAAEISYDTNTNPVGTIATAGGGVLDAMRTVETTEDGVLFDARDNTLTFHGRERRYNTTSLFTLDASTQQIETDVSPKLDRSTLANDVTATTSDDGSSARAINQDSIDEYGYARATMDIAGNQDAGFQAATWRVLLYGEPLPRILALSVDLLPLSAALQASVLGAEISDRITVAGLPAQAPATSIDFFIEGYTESIGPSSYEFSFNISPTNDELRTVWVLEDATYGVYEDYPLGF